MNIYFAVYNTEEQQDRKESQSFHWIVTESRASLLGLWARETGLKADMLGNIRITAEGQQEEKHMESIGHICFSTR